MNKWIRRFLWLLAILFVLLNVLCAFQAYSLTHYYESAAQAPMPTEAPTAFDKTKALLLGPDNYKLAITTEPKHPYSNFDVQTSDGIRLNGWDIPHPKSRGTVILFHGHGGNRAGLLNEAEVFYQLGYSIVMADLRAHGRSAGVASAIGYKEAMDVKAVYDYTRNRGAQHVVLYGISLGAAAITKALHDYPSLKPEKVILEMPFGTLEDAVKGRLRLMQLPEQPMASLLTFWGGIEQGFWAFSNKPEEYAKSIDMPVLQQWGRRDVRVSQAETENIFANIPGTHKKLVVYEESGHQSLCTNEPLKWRREITAFLSSK